MKQIHIDIESYSEADLSKCGAYRYAEDPSFEILLFGYSIDGDPVRVIDLTAGEDIPENVLSALTDESVTKWGHHVAFERVCLSTWLKKHHPGMIDSESLDPSSWRCSMVWAAYMGLPLSLKDVGTALKLEDQKMDEGKSLIRYFCVPCRPTKSNSGRTRNLPEHAPDKWEVFKAYNARDVEVEMAITEKLKDHPVPDSIWEEYRLDQEINDRGIAVDMEMVSNAMDMMDERVREEVYERLKAITGLENPNSVMQMREWLLERGTETDSLDKKTVEKLLLAAPPDLAEVLRLRQRISKSSTKKYEAMSASACSDNRLRGMFRFYGANRTGRWSSRIINLQNLARNAMPDLDDARFFVRAGDYDALSMYYDSVPDVLSELVRTALVPQNGYKFIVADFSAIEARVLSYLAGEQWRIDAFHNGEDIYCASASRMFGVPVEKHGVNAELRATGKVAELACIAEDSPVLTDKGLVPIQDVTKDHLLWDGKAWVRHDGVVCRGIRDVVTCEGLTATPDHIVWYSWNHDPIPLSEVMKRGLHLLQTGECQDITRRDGRLRVYDILNAGDNTRFTVSGKLVHNCGYGGGVGALKAFGAVEMGIKEDELQGIIDNWRSSNPNIVNYWRIIGRAALKAVEKHTRVSAGSLIFECDSDYLFITLPSGRKLSYATPGITINRFGSRSITYYGIDGSRHWSRIETYNSRIVENCVQAISRDILANAMKSLSSFRIVAHVHDEVIIEAPMDMSVDEVCDIMGRTPEWMPGLELTADGYECGYYMKS